MRLDKDIKRMNTSQRGQEIARLRKLIRSHKKKSENARCWMNDTNLYQQALPEGSKDRGYMDIPIDKLLTRCKAYIQTQQRKKP